MRQAVHSSPVIRCAAARAVVSALLTARRCQRSGPQLPRDGNSWRAKVAAYDRQYQQQQQQQERQQQQRPTRGRVAAPGRHADFFRGEPSDEEQRASARAAPSPARAPRTREEFASFHDIASSDRNAVPQFSFVQSLWLRFGGGRGERRQTMPLNPLHRDRADAAIADSSLPGEQHVSRLLTAVEALHARSTRPRSRRGSADAKDNAVGVQLSEEDMQEIVWKYASTKWWGPLYKPFRHVSNARVRRLRRISVKLMVLCCVILVVALIMMYVQETRMISQLSPEDRRDYVYMVSGMRYDDIVDVATAIRAKEDPLGALPPAAIMHLVVEEGRRRHWHEMDWAVESRKLHPDSAIDEHHWLHLLYWAAMYAGHIVTGASGSIFAVAPSSSATAERSREPLAPEEPMAAPAAVKRSFFS